MEEALTKVQPQIKKESLLTLNASMPRQLDTCIKIRVKRQSIKKALI